MADVVNLLEQKIKGLNDLKESTQNVQSSIKDAYESNLKSVSQKTNIDTARDWAVIQITDSFEKGKKAGYAEACKDFVGIMNTLLAQIETEEKGLVDLYQQVKNVGLSEIENATLSEEEKSDPLVSREKEEFLS